MKFSLKKYLQKLLLLILLLSHSIPAYAAVDEYGFVDGAVGSILKFFVKISLLVAAAMAPILLGDKIAAAIKGGFTTARKSLQGIAKSGVKMVAKPAVKSAWKGSKLGAKIGLARDAKEKGSRLKALEEMANNHPDPSQRLAAKTELKSELHKKMDNASKDYLIDKASRHSHEVLRPDGKPLMKDIQDPNYPDDPGKRIDTPVRGFDPRLRPDIAAAFDKDYESQVATEILGESALADDNLTGREQFVGDQGAYLASEGSDSLAASKKGGPAQLLSPNALGKDTNTAGGIVTSQSRKVNPEKMASWGSSFVQEIEQNYGRIEVLADQYETAKKTNPANAPRYAFAQVDAETKHSIQTNPRDVLQARFKPVINNVFGETHRSLFLDKTRPDYSQVNTKHFQKFMGAPKLLNLLGSQERADALADLAAIKNNEIPPSVKRAHGEKVERAPKLITPDDPTFNPPGEHRSR